MNKIALFYALILLLLAVPELFPEELPGFTFSVLNSNYRKLDKSEKSVPVLLRKYFIKDIGIGNVIFSESPLEVENEAGFVSVTDRFNFQNAAKGLHALAYLPGRKKELVSYIEDKYEDCKFACVYVLLAWHPLSSLKKDGKDSTASLPYDPKTMVFDQENFKIFPQESGSVFKEFSLLAIPSFGSAEHIIEASVYLRFSVGTISVTMSGLPSMVEMTSTLDTSDGTIIEKRIKNVGNTNINEEPVFRDFLVSFGRFILVN